MLHQVGEKLALVPGKLDHATVVAYCVGPFDTSSPPSPITQRRVLPLDVKTHIDRRHHTRTADPDYPVFASAGDCDNEFKHYALTKSPTAPCSLGASAWGAPLASPDSARSVAIQLEEFKMAASVLPPLPETSPPRTRVTLAREESIELLTDDMVQHHEGESKYNIREYYNESTPRNCAVIMQNESTITPSETKSSTQNVYIDESTEISSAREINISGKKSADLLNQKKNNSERDDASQRTARNIDDRYSTIHLPRSIATNHEIIKNELDQSLVIKKTSSYKRTTADSVLESDRLDLLLQGSSNKENLSPNFTFQLPLHPVVETLL